MSNVLEQVKQRLKDAIRQAMGEIGLSQEGQHVEIALETPKEKVHGDFSTNVAMQLTRIAKRNPRQIADDLVKHMDGSAAHVARMEIAGPGFINFYMDKRYLHQIVPFILQQGDRYGRIELGEGRRIQVEFVSANPTGSLHLGHARGAAVGDALCNLLDFAGYRVEREYYINDAGKQIENLAASMEARYRQLLGQEAEMPEDGYYGEDIVGFARELMESRGDALLAMSNEERKAFLRSYGLERELDKIRRDLSRFRVRFDTWFSETSLYESGKPESILKELGARGETYEEDGAVWLRTTSYGDDKNRVLVKNDGSYTYLTPDIAYHQDKLSRGFDQLINIWGADHHGYVPRMKAALSALGHDSERLMVLIAQMVSLYQDGEKVKMSKRTGKAVTMVDLMDEVGVDAVRYFFAMRSIDSHLDFDMDLAVSRSNENPVYYVQYAHARICSIFRQADEQGVSLDGWDTWDLSRLVLEAEYDLLGKMAAFSEEVGLAAEQYAPHRMIRYVYELAAMFHSYYRAERVITEDMEVTRARLALLGALGIVVRNVLKLVGVSAPERM